MTDSELKFCAENVISKLKELRQEILNLSKELQVHIDAELEKTNDAMQTQAQSKEIKIIGKAKQ